MGRSYYLRIEMQLGGYDLTGKYPDQIGPDSPATTLSRARASRRLLRRADKLQVGMSAAGTKSCDFDSLLCPEALRRRRTTRRAS